MSRAAVQAVFLPPGIRSYSVVCQHCMADASPRHGYFGPIVEGELPEGAPYLTRRCPRGHRITLVARSRDLKRSATSGDERTMDYSTA
jgi:hypothetical protein